MRYILSVLCFCSCHPSNNNPDKVFSGSSVICLVTKDSILIGADSKVNVEGQIGKNYIPRYCKVFSIENIIYGGAGFLMHKGNTVIEPLKIIRSIPVNNRNLYSYIVEVYYTLKEPLLYVANFSRNANQKYFDENVLNKRLCAFVFGTFENNKPIIGFLDLKVRATSKNILAFEVGIDTSTIVPNYLPLGETEYFSQMLTKDSNFVDKSRNHLTLLHSLIKGQCKLTPDRVNDTINIIKMKANGITWAERYQECE